MMPDATALMPAVRKIVEANGIAFEIFEACKEGATSDRLALLLHGFPEHAISWRAQVPVLAAQGYRVWSVNLRGYGDTSTPPAGNYGLDVLLADIAGLIDAAGARTATLIAHDWGALLAWAFAIRRIRPLEKLVILNVPHPLCFRAALKHWRQKKKSWYAAFFQIPGLADWALSRRDGRPVVKLLTRTAANPDGFSREALAIYAANAARPAGANGMKGISGMLAYYREAARDLMRAGDLDTVIETPTLVVWGEKDAALDLICLEETERYVKDLTIERLPHASHWVQQDAPDEVNRIVGAFLGKSISVRSP